MKTYTRSANINSKTYLKFFNLNMIQDDVNANAAHLPSATLLTYQHSELKQVASKVHDLAVVLGYPFIIRSSTEFEDHADHHTSGLFESRIVREEGEILESVEAIHRTFLDVDHFGGLGLIIQEYIEISMGAVISTMRKNDRFIIIAELSSKTVPVDGEPEYSYSWLKECEHYRSLDYNKIDLKIYESALQMVSVVTQLNISTLHPLEFEIGTSPTNRIYLFQVREARSLDYPRALQFQNFGGNRSRNYA